MIGASYPEEYFWSLSAGAYSFGVTRGPTGLPLDFNIGPRNYTVHVLIERSTGKAAYVGMTQNPAARERHWGTRFKFEPQATGLTRQQARAVEQALISNNASFLGKGRFFNKINSIAERRGWQTAGKTWGAQRLRKAGRRLRWR